MVGRYAASAWGVEIDKVKADKGNALMRLARQRLAARNAKWSDIPLPHIRCAPIEEVRGQGARTTCFHGPSCAAPQMPYSAGSWDLHMIGLAMDSCPEVCSMHGYT